MSIKWNFRAVSDSQVKQDPIQSEFFTSDQTSGLTSGLVRESIQNSIDAREEKKHPVEVRFKITSKVELFELDRSESFLYGLKKHLEAPKNGLRVNLNSININAKTLIIEDANTTGLQGDPKQVDDFDDIPAEEQSFYYFWRNVGRSGKNSQDKGRWGLGKTVFPAASRINTFFGLSVSNSDHNKTLMGQAILKTHYLNGKRHSPYGYFASFETTPKDPDFANPIERKNFLNRLEHGFDLLRGNNPGLSIIIPYIRDEITFENLLRDVIEQYYYAILSDELKVDLESDSKSIAINKNSLLKVINDIDFESSQKKNEIIHKIEFTQWTLKVNPNDIFDFNALESNLVPRWIRNKLIPKENENTFEDFRKRFTSGEKISFKIPIKSHQVGHKPEASFFKVYLQYKLGSEISYSEYIRDGITISGINGFKKDGLTFILVVNDKPLSTLLGDSENPAHTEWQKKSSHFRDKYIDGEEIISFVTRSPEILYNWMYVVPDTVKQDLLNNFLSISEKKNGDYQKNNQENEEGETPDGPDDEIISNPPLINISKIDGGIKVTHGGRKELERVIMNFAYDLRRGNPFKRYDPIDFDLSKTPMSLTQIGLSIESNQENIIIYNPKDKEYSLEVIGFDKNRDIKISARKYD